MSESSLKIICWCLLWTSLLVLFAPIFYITFKEMGIQGLAVVAAYIIILSIIIIPGYFYGKGPLSRDSV